MSRILVVDDDPASCDVVAYFLKSLGYHTAIAADGSRALNMDFGDEVALVILDVHMPSMEGPELLAMLRARRRPPRVIAVTGDESRDVRERMVGLGIDGFLTKPVDLDALREAVNQLLPAGSNDEGALHQRVRERGPARTEGQSVDPRSALRRSVR